MEMVEREFDPARLDAVFDIDGTVLKYTSLQTYTQWLSDNRVIQTIPQEIQDAEQAWRASNTEENYVHHTGLLVKFFAKQVAEQGVERLQWAARFAAAKNANREWNVMCGIADALRDTHNIMAISMMPEWLMPAFTERLRPDLQRGSHYATEEGVLTGEATTIHKLDAYLEARDGDLGRLDFAAGDTVGDAEMLMSAAHAVAFNPSYTLSKVTRLVVPRISAGKDYASLLMPNAQRTGYDGYEFHHHDVESMLQLIMYRTVRHSR